MLWPEILAAVKLFLSIIPAEVDFGAATQDAYNVFLAGWSKGAFLKALIADQVKVFPDVRTRPFAVLVLQSILDLIGAGQAPAAPLP
jgi:hypothetical protein